MVATAQVGILLLVLPFLLTPLCQLYTEAYYVQVDAQGEECFFEQGKAGATMVLSFEVTEGGLPDIDVDVTGPDNDAIYHRVRETSGHYSFAAYQDGPYKFCFSNRMSTVTPKMVMFTFNTGLTPSESLYQTEDDRARSKLEEIVKELAAAIMAVKHEQEHMVIREKIHRAISDDINRRVLLWSFFEAAVFLAMTICQIYLKSFFQNRRMILQADSMA